MTGQSDTQTSPQHIKISNTTVSYHDLHSNKQLNSRHELIEARSKRDSTAIRAI